MIHVMISSGVPIRNDQLTERGAINYGAVYFPITKRKRMQNQAFFGCEADAKLPVLPLDSVTIDFEVRPVRLNNIECSQCRANFETIRTVVTRIRWQWYYATVFDAKDGHRI